MDILKGLFSQKKSYFEILIQFLGDPSAWNIDEMCQIIEGSNGETKLKTIDSNLKKDTKNDSNKKSIKKKNGLKKKKVSFFVF